MAKKSIIAREHKRKRMVAKYADLRKKLKEAGDYDALDKFPAIQTHPLAQPLLADGTSKRLYAQIWYMPCQIPRNGFVR
jgi:hypothetical protein